jgi:hypothetical protein
VIWGQVRLANRIRRGLNLEIVRAGFLAPLVKARGFGMTPSKIKPKYLRKFEFYGDLGLDGDGLIAQVVGLVFPLLDRVDCGVGENRVTA